MKSIKEIAEFVGGEIKGANDTLIRSVAKIEEAQSGDLTFVSNPKYIKYLSDTKASAVFVKIGLEFELREDISYVFVEDPYFAICIVMDAFFNPVSHPSHIEKMSFVSDSAKVGKDVYVGAFAYISEEAELGNNVKIYPNAFVGKGAKIGANTVVYSNVSIYDSCEVGTDCIIHSGTVVGSDGFGHAPLPDGSYAKIPQIGNVVIGNYVEIGSNCSIDRATMGSTRIEDGVKLDNLIQVAHNAAIGKNTVIAAQTGLSGSTSLGERCVIGGQVGFVGHITVANGTQIGAQSGIMKAIKKENQQFLGSPIKLVKDEIKAQVLIRKLPELYNDIQELKGKLEE